MSAAAELLDIGVRRLGSSKVHRARVPEAVLYPAKSFGVPCIGIKGPIVARCGSTLRGQLIEIPPEVLAMDSQRPYQCAHCLSEVRHDFRARSVGGETHT